MKNSYSVSLIMSTYNRKEYLDKSISCCLNQDFQNYEVILINNNSTDGTDLVCKEYAKNNQKIKYFKNTGINNISGGRNLGISKASGEYILFVDDDDYFENDLISFLYNQATALNADCSICGSSKDIDGKVIDSLLFNEKLVLSNKEAVFELLKRVKYNAALPTKMLRRSLFTNLKFDEAVPYDDIVFTYKILAECNKVIFNGESKYTFMRHSTNNSAFTTNDSLITPYQLDIYFNAFRERTLYLTNKFPDMADYWLYTELSYMISMVNKISINNLSNCFPQRDYAISILLKNLSLFSSSNYLLDFEVDFINKYLK